MSHASAHRSRRRHICAAAAAAALLAVSNPLASLSPAAATVITGYAGPSVQVNPTTIGTLATDLTLTLHPGNPHDSVSPGQLPPGSLAGYVFSVKRVAGIDVTTAAGYATATSMTVERARAFGFDSEEQQISGESGQVVFLGLPPGLYLVDITAPDRPEVLNQRIDPMLLILPVSAPEGGWLSEVTITVKSSGESPGPSATVPPVPPSSGIPPTLPPVPPLSGGGSSVPPAPAGSSPATTPSAPQTSVPRPSAGLAQTGASVIGLAIAAVLLLGLGVYLARRRTDDDGSASA